MGQATVDSILTESRTGNSKFEIGLYVSENVEKEFRLEILSSCPTDNSKFPPMIQIGRKQVGRKCINIKWLNSYKRLAYSEIYSVRFVNLRFIPRPK